MAKWTPAFEKQGVQVNYQKTGSGPGVAHMIDGTAEFGCSDAFMTDEQLKAAKEKGGEVVHIPLAMGAIVLAYKRARRRENL